MARVLISNFIPEDAKDLIKKYVDYSNNSTSYEYLDKVGIKGKVKNTATRPDIVIVVIDETLYSECNSVKTISEVLVLPKFHKYTTLESLRLFLISKCGEIDIEEEVIEEKIEPIIEQQEVDSNISINLQLEIDSLSAKLATKDMLLQNLKLQFEEDKENNDTLYYTSKIAELQSTIEDLKNNTQDDIDKSEDIVTLTAQLTKVLQEKQLLTDNIKTFEQSYEEIKLETVQLEGYRDKYMALSKQVTEKDNELYTLRDKEKVLSDEVSTLKGNLISLHSTETDLKIATEELAQKNTEFNNLSLALNSLNDTFTSTKKELDMLRLTTTDEIKALSDKFSQVTDNYTNALLDIDRLNADVVTLNEQLDVFQKDNSNQTILESLTNEITLKDNTISALSNTIQSLKSDIDKKTEEFNLRGNDIKLLNSEILELKDTVSNFELKNYTSIIEDKDTTIVSQSAEIKDLRHKLSDSTSKLDNIDNSNKSDLVVLQNTIDRLNNEIMSYDSAKLTLETRVQNLSSQINRLNSTTQTQAKEISRLHNSESEFNSDVFTSLSKYARSPRTSMSYKLPIDLRKFTNVTSMSYIGASSQDDYYNLLLSQVKKQPTQKVLIIDFTIESQLDLVFKSTPSSVPAFNWVSRKDTFENTKSKTSFNNVDILTPTLGYFNSLSLLKLDWEDLLNEVAYSYDSVILAIGDISDALRYILHNTFSVAFQNLIVVKGSPFNLRTASFVLKGCSESNTTSRILCTQYVSGSNENLLNTVKNMIQVDIVDSNMKLNL